MPGFRLFFANTVFSSVDMNVRIAVHGWLVLELSGDSPFWVGIFAFVLGAGQLLFSSIAGAIVDRFQRRNVLVVEGISSTVLAAGLALATYYDVAELWWVIAQFNQKPTDSHYSLGDVVYIPLPLEKVLTLYGV